MKQEPITIDDSKLEEVRKMLVDLGQQWKPTPHNKLSFLKPLRAEILALKRQKKMANAQIAEFLTKAGIPVSADTVRRFLVTCGYGKRRPRTSKKLSGSMTRPGLTTQPNKSAANAPAGFNTIKDDEL